MSDQNQETCKYEKFGICNMREHCPKFHPIENCIDDNCSTVKCRKRHPQPCRYFGTQIGCRFGSSCKFDHHRQMCHQSKLEELQTKHDMLQAKHDRLQSNQERLIQEKKLQDEQMKILNQKIVTLENNVLSFMKDTLVSNDIEAKTPSKRKRDETEHNVANKSSKKSEKKTKGTERTSDHNPYKKIENDVEMGEEVAIENTIDQDLIKVFEQTVNTLHFLKTKLKSIKKEESVINLRKIKDQYQALEHHCQDVKVFVRQLETSYSKWISYRNNFKFNAGKDLDGLINTMENIKDLKIKTLKI